MNCQRRPSGLLKNFCDKALPLLRGCADGDRILETVSDIVATERWNSFDRFHETTETLQRNYEQTGAEVEVYPIQTGGPVSSGHWIINEAADITSATVKIVSPVRMPLLNYRDNPWHVIQWSASTPRSGMTNDLIIVDSPEDMSRMPANRLAGKMALTRMAPRDLLPRFSAEGAAGIICDKPVKNLPDATAWLKFGWGGLAVQHAGCRLVGLALSANDGKKLRRLLKQHGRLRLHTKVEIRNYVGTHDVVSGVIRGAANPQEEVWAFAHSMEPGAADNASGLAVEVEIARIIERAIATGMLPRPKRTIRLVSGYECYGLFGYIRKKPRMKPLAGVVIDCVGVKPNVCSGVLGWYATIPTSAGFVDRIGKSILRRALKLQNPGYRLHSRPFVSTEDTLIGDPKYGFPCPFVSNWMGLREKAYTGYHSSGDTVDILSPECLSLAATAMAGYLYFLANMGTAEAMALASAETRRAMRQVRNAKKKLTPAAGRYLQDAHHETIKRLKRWLWAGNRDQILTHMDSCENDVRQAVSAVVRHSKKRRRSVPGATRVPRRCAPVAPAAGNTPAHVLERIKASGLQRWAHYWADGNRTLAEIAESLSCEYDKQVNIRKVMDFFEAYEELGFVRLKESR